MSCVFCVQENKEDFTLYNDCVLVALEKIKNHYLYIKNESCKKDQQLEQLQKRNEKLAKAIELLQHEQLHAFSSRVTANSQSPKRRRKISLAPTDTIDLSLNDVEPNVRGQCADVAAADQTTDDLNMALNSEQLFDCTTASNFTQWSPNHNETIDETEKVKSPPRVLRTSFQIRRELQKRKLRKHSNNNNSENSKPGSKDGWMCKERADSGKSLVGILEPSRCVGSFVNQKSKAAECIKEERKPSLSLKKTRKLKQTRLQLDVSREKSFCGSDSTFCEEAIDASPNPLGMLKQSKSARSWLLRTNNSFANTSHRQITNENMPLVDEDAAKFQSDDDFGQIFKFTETSAIEKPQTNAAKPEEFELRMDVDECLEKTANADDDINKIESTDSSSVMILTPATQDIIFLDDTYDNNTHIASMDLLQELMKCDDNELEQLKRVEREKIIKLQKTVSSLNAALQADHKANLNQQVNTKKLTLKTPVTTAKQSKIIENAGIQIKQENILQDVTQTVCKNVMSQENSENLMPQPFVVKRETHEQEIAKTIKEVKPQKQSIKEKFNINCKDCQQYIDFLGDRMTDKEIMEHLRRCTRHQPREVDMHCTPDDFWNPFIATLDENDPRNETLIDTRFCDKNK